MKVVVNDANILIDLVKLELIQVFVEIDFDLHTTDFIMEELYSDQQMLLTKFIESGKLILIETQDFLDYQGIIKLLENNNGLSFEDCSVWYYCKKMSGTLLTGDGKLRTRASKEGIEVRGIHFIFDELLKQNLIGFQLALEKLQELSLFNNRLPKSEIDLRIFLWNNGKHNY